jgi:FkbM family methyltransferase
MGGTLATILLGIMMSYALVTVKFMAEGPGNRQDSRMTAWDSGMPSDSSYGYASTGSLNTNAITWPRSTSTSFDSNLRFFLSKTSGPGWEMWDRSSVLFNDLNLTCNWNDYRPFLKRGKVASAVPFCAHPLSDDHFVSNSVVKKGRHIECDGLPVLLDQSMRAQMEGTSGQAPIYVDIGANIGTCVMQMLLTTNATIVAFEPHPYNLFVMTSTFMKLEENLRNRIHLFPIALGAESSESTIHMASDNRGHAVVSKVIRINKKATFLPPLTIRVEPLDSIIKKNTVIHLVKMDAQGFECYIFDGMQQVLLTTRAVFFELEKTVLNGFDKCSPLILWDKFIKARFEMHVGGLGGSATQDMPDKGKVNIVALIL